jgi:Glycosyl hydrolase family 26
VVISNRRRLLTILTCVAALSALLGAAPAAPASASRIGLSQARTPAGADRCSKRVSLDRKKARTLRRCSARQSALRTKKYWGAWIGSQLTGAEAPWDMGAVSSFEQLAGKPVSMIHFSSPFADCSVSPCRFYGFQGAVMDQIRAHGAIPFFSWGSQSTPASLEQPDFQLSDVIAGSYDSYIRSFAEEARDWGHPFFLRFNWEMNGNWFAWMEGVNGNRPGESVTAWRHVHDIFTEVGATNATWVWCPNVDPSGNLRDLASLYPGDEYVDWTGLDGYNWGTARGDRWLSFDQLYRSTYDYITKTLAPSKPLVIAEVGSSEHGGSKSAWIEDALDSVATGYPKVRALLWFEKYDDGMDWPIETSSAATAAFAAGISNAVFAGASNADGAAEAIPAPN